MAERTCHNCVYAVCDPGVWLRSIWRGEHPWAQCANHPSWPGELHEVSGVPCRNYRPRPPAPKGDAVRMIPLGDACYAYVDAADYGWLSRWNWHFLNGYAIRRENGKVVFMHRQIMQPVTDRVKTGHRGSGQNQPVLFVISYTFCLRPAREFVVVESPDWGRAQGWVARIGGRGRMGPTRARRSLAAAGRAGQTGRTRPTLSL